MTRVDRAWLIEDASSPVDRPRYLAQVRDRGTFWTTDVNVAWCNVTRSAARELAHEAGLAESQVRIDEHEILASFASAFPIVKNAGVWA